MRLRAAPSLLAIVVAVSVLAVPALAQRAPMAVPRPVPAAPAVAPPVAPSSGSPGIAGIAVGGPMSVVDVKCKEPGVTCVRSTRTVGAVALDRVRVDLPAPAEMVRVIVTGRGGVVLGVRGRYRTIDAQRTAKLRAARGNAVLRRGRSSWSQPSGVVTELGLRGESILHVDTKAAAAKGLALDAAKFLALAPRVESVRPPAKEPLSPLRASTAAGRVGDLTLELPPTPTVTQTQRIPVKITLERLKCFDENDLTSIFYGDDPYVDVVGTHSSLSAPKPWYQQKAFGDVESGDSRTLNMPVFPEGDVRRSIGWGEAVGVQITVSESDLGNNDEIDTAYPIVDYTFARANQNKSLPFTEVLSGDGAQYTLSYRVEIGAATNDPTPVISPNRYRAVDARQWAGTFAGSLGDAAGDATLTFVASKDPAFPNGVLQGQMKDAGVLASVRTTRLLGDSVELFVRYPSGSPATLVGYLIGEGADKRLVGTLTRDGVTRGVNLVRK